MDWKTQIPLIAIASVFWVLAATALIAPGTRSVGASHPDCAGGFAGEPDFVKDVRRDVAAFVIASF